MKDNFKHKASKNSGFTIPKGYFDSFNEELDTKIRANSFPESPGFKAPGGYFDTFEVKIEKQKPKGKRIEFFFSKFKYAAAAAIVVGFLSTFYLLIPSNGSYDKLYNSISQQEIDSWFDQNEIEISSIDMVAVYSDDLSEATDLLESNFNEQNITTYLQESSETEIVIDEFY
jgi:hypothetical protein